MAITAQRGRSTMTARVLAVLGPLALLVWLLGVADWVSLSAVGGWIAFGLGVGLLALGSLAAAAGYRDL